MYIPIKVDYGVRALVDLALNGKEGPVRASEIARRTVIPEQYLAQVLHALNKSGFTGSRRGPHGGHFLAKAPSEIRLSAVLACLGGSESLVACLSDNTICIHSRCCAQQEVWRTVAEAVFGILDSTTIADLANRTPITPDNPDSGERNNERERLPIALQTAV